MGVVAQLATIENDALARVASAQFRSLLDVVVVADMPARDSALGALSPGAAAPDVLAMTHAAPFRCGGAGLVGLF